MSQNPLDPTWLSIPFAKFSHNSSLYGTRNFTWNHVGARNDLNFILRNTRVADENGNFHTRILMKINAGAEELELQDLGELLQHLHTFDPSTGAEIPLQVVVKRPFLAMRYPKSGNVVRRIQLKFHNDFDFAKVLNCMKDLGLPITKPPAAAPSISRPPTVSPSPSILSATSGSTSLTVPSMMSASSLSSSGVRITLPTPGISMHPATRPNSVDKLNELTPTSLSKPDFKVPERPTSSFSEATAPISVLPYSIPQIPRPATTSGFFSSPACSSRAGPDLSHSSMRQPTSLYISQKERESPNRRQSLSTLEIIKISQEDSYANLSQLQSQKDSQNHTISEPAQYPSLSQFQSQQRSQHHSISENSQCQERKFTQSPFLAPKNASPELGGSIIRELNPSDNNYDNRDLLPQTLTSALIGAGSGQGLNLLLPPKRTLPFPKPREVSMQRSGSLSDLLSLPKPTAVSHPSSTNVAAKLSAPVPKPTKKRVAQRKPTLIKAPVVQEIVESPSSEKGNGSDAAAQTSPQDEPSPLAAKSAAAASRPASAASALQSKAAPKKRAAFARPASAAKRAKMVDQATQTQTFSGRDHTSALQSFRNEESPAPAVAVSNLQSTPAAPPESYLDAVDGFITKHKARPPPQELWERPGYAEADVEERQLLLNNFICENLESKDFLQLCEDTANAWRRIGFGM